MLTGSGLSMAESVVLQLPWHHQFQFAGYYAAIAQGYYADEGIDVEVRAGVDDKGELINPVAEVVFQRAQFGVTRSDLLTHHARGLPVVMLAAVMQRTPAAFITLDKYNIDKLEDIGHQPVSLPLTADKPDAMIDTEIITTLERAGIDIDQLNNSPENWSLKALQSGQTHLILGYATDAPYILRRRGFNPVVISPMDYGIDLYGELLFTSESTLRQNPELVERFRNASMKGWEYALAHTEETANYILSHYSVRGADYDLDFLLHEAEALRAYIQPDLIEIGYSNPARWQRIAGVYKQADMIDTLALNRFLYSPEDDSKPGWWLWLSLVIISLLLIAVGWLFCGRCRLLRAVKHSEQRESSLKRQAETDPLTGLVNRRRFSLELDVGYLRARQEGEALSVLMLDVDHFKDVNDEFGHIAGDTVLCSLARLCQSATRETDVLCRYGGEEFAFLLIDTSLKEAEEVAQRVMEAVRKDKVEWYGMHISYTVSIGVAELNLQDEQGLDLLRRTDRHLYRAKAAGRDTIFSEQPGPLSLVK